MAERAAMESEWEANSCHDLSRNGLTEFPDQQLIPLSQRSSVESLQLHHNRIGFIPPDIQDFTSLVILDVSNNSLSHIAVEFSSLPNLQTLIAKNNSLDNDSLPKAFDQLQSLVNVNLGGNNLTEFPPQLIHMPNIQRLNLASNKIAEVPNTIQHITSLEVLNLGDNLLAYIPVEFGALSNLTTLNLACNRLRSLPSSLMRLYKLKSLSLHNNCLSTLPPEIVAIDLVELSLRNNPLVHRFVENMVQEVPSLLELSGRTVKLAHISPPPGWLPNALEEYLSSANKCVNPRCKGVFFTSKVEHVKFVDFCGKYRLPLLQYLCSTACLDGQPCVEGLSDSESDEDMAAAMARMKRVLLG